jgi:AraC-like DNA-binding protein
MVTVDADALSEVLASLDLRVGIGRRAPLTAGALLPLAPGALTLVYVAEGAVHGHPPLTAGCRLDVDRASGLFAAPTEGDRRHLVAGDALLSLGRRPLALEADGDSTLIVVDLELSDTTAHLATLLPDFASVFGFADLEPAAAALAANMGQLDPDRHPERSGDGPICRMMAATVLLSVIRAWAANGCAPDGWPAVAKDPFLERVVDAIHDDPGREWTVESLASVGAMSRSVFAERFRRAVGSSPASYVTAVRIDAAKRMLEAGRSVSETSRELGYASDEGFSRAFRRSTGMTPSLWRQTRRAAVPA